MPIVITQPTPPPTSTTPWRHDNERYRGRAYNVRSYFFNYFSFYYWRWLFPPHHVVLNKKELWHRGHTPSSTSTTSRLTTTSLTRNAKEVCHITRDGCTILQRMLIFYFHSTTDHCCSEEHVEEHTPSLTSATSRLTTNFLARDAMEVSGLPHHKRRVYDFIFHSTTTD